MGHGHFYCTDWFETNEPFQLDVEVLGGSPLRETPGFTHSLCCPFFVEALVIPTLRSVTIDTLSVSFAHWYWNMRGPKDQLAASASRSTEPLFCALV